MNSQQTRPPALKEHRHETPAVPIWNAAETENQDPYQEPGFLIRNSFGV